MLTVLGILALLVLPSLIGLVRDRRIDRQIRQAYEYRAARRTTRTV
jgi:type II secretory pathway pseudopilin PulG